MRVRFAFEVIRHQNVTIRENSRHNQVQATQADALSHNHNKIQTQLQLATNLLRLGRRTEGLELLERTEKQLGKNLSNPENLGQLLWAALIRDIIDQKQQAKEIALAVTFQSNDPASDRLVKDFFHINLR